MVATGELKWILLLTVYGVETVATIVERLRLKENIFKAHRRHLYQLLVNDKKVPHIRVSITYAALQLVLSAVLLLSDLPQWIIIPAIIIPAITLYLIVKSSIKRQIARR